MTQESVILPYGVADYTKISHERMAYVDKTSYIPVLERTGRYLFFLRPRRFGKSLSISTMSAYYDLNFKDRFEALFGDTWIGKNPTRERNSYMILRFSFAEVSSEPETLQRSFETYTETRILGFLARYPDAFDNEVKSRIAALPSAADRMAALSES